MANEDAARRIEADRAEAFNPVDHYDGQGTIVDRSAERLGQSDAGIALLRRITLRELDAIRDGSPTKTWRPLPHAQDLPIQGEPVLE